MVIGNSHDADTLARLRVALGARPVDLLFIDGDHTLDGVRHDYEWYAPLVAPGGHVAFHDIYGHFMFPTMRVDALWWEIRRDHPDNTWEIVNRRRPWGHGMGIGVLQCV
jgi:predicted O-methyltransferase YrrM